MTTENMSRSKQLVMKGQGKEHGDTSSVEVNR